MTTEARPLPAPPSGSVFASDEYKEIMNKLHQEADKPKPTYWAAKYDWEMPNAHIALLDPLYRAYCLADWAVEHDDVENYLNYAESCIAMINEHHGFEENIQFPGWSKYSGLSIWDQNIQQHHLFSEPQGVSQLYLRNCRKFIPDCKPSPVNEPVEEIKNIDIKRFPLLDFTKPFDPKAFRNHLDSYLMIMLRHMTEELDTLSPENFEKVGEENVNEITGKVFGYIQTLNQDWFMGAATAAVSIEKLGQMMPIPPNFKFPAKFGGTWKYAGHPENLIWDSPAAS